MRTLGSAEDGLSPRETEVGLTLEQLGSATRLSKGFLSEVERDVTSPSVASLLAICEALGIAIGSLFEGGDRQLVLAYNASKAAVHHLTRSLAAPGVGRAWVGPGGV